MKKTRPICAVSERESKKSMCNYSRYERYRHLWGYANGVWLLVVGLWLLDFGCWTLVVGLWGLK